MNNESNEDYSQTAWWPVKPLVKAHLRKAVNKPQSSSWWPDHPPWPDFPRGRFAHFDCIQSIDIWSSGKWGLYAERLGAHRHRGLASCLTGTRRDGDMWCSGIRKLARPQDPQKKNRFRRHNSLRRQGDNCPWLLRPGTLSSRRRYRIDDLIREGWLSDGNKCASIAGRVDIQLR